MSAIARQLDPDPGLGARGGSKRAAAWMVVCGRLLTPAVVFGSLWVAVRVRALAFGPAYEVLGVVAGLACVLIFDGFGVNRAHWRSGSLLDLGSLLLAWATSAGVLLLLGYLTKTTAQFSRLALTTWFVLAFLLLCLLHMFFWAYFGWLQRKGVGVLSGVIGPMTPTAVRLAETLRGTRSFGVRLLGYFDDRPCERAVDLPWLGSFDGIAHYALENRVDAVYISLENSADEELSRTLEALQGGASSIYLIPHLYAFDLLRSELQSVGGISLLAVGAAEMPRLGGLFKRLVDVVGSAFALALLSPLFAVVSAVIKLDSPGPVIFRQKRCGLHNEEITIYKFRSMYICDNETGAVRPATNRDPRITRVGTWLRRTSIDELPQLWNVLWGSMSLVGPRPHPLAFDDEYRRTYRGYRLRHKVVPGITGWAQINGCRGDTGSQGDIQRRLDYDLEYIRRWSPVLDLWILLRTLPALLKNREVY